MLQHTWTPWRQHSGSRHKIAIKDVLVVHRVHTTVCQQHKLHLQVPGRHQCCSYSSSRPPARLHALSLARLVITRCRAAMAGCWWAHP